MTVITRSKNIFIQNINANNSIDIVVDKVHLVAGGINELVHTVNLKKFKSNF